MRARLPSQLASLPRLGLEFARLVPSQRPVPSPSLGARPRPELLRPLFGRADPVDVVLGLAEPEPEPSALGDRVRGSRRRRCATRGWTKRSFAAPGIAIASAWSIRPRSISSGRISPANRGSPRAAGADAAGLLEAGAVQVPLLDEVVGDRAVLLAAGAPEVERLRVLRVDHGHPAVEARVGPRRGGQRTSSTASGPQSTWRQTATVGSPPCSEKSGTVQRVVLTVSPVSGTRRCTRRPGAVDLLDRDRGTAPARSSPPSAPSTGSRETSVFHGLPAEKKRGKVFAAPRPGIIERPDWTLVTVP